MKNTSNAAVVEFNNLTKWTTVLLYVQIAVAIVTVISHMLEYELLLSFKLGTYESEELAVAAGEASDLRQLVIAYIGIATYAVAGFVILRWIYRASSNLRILGATGMAFTPGWAVGWYFVPIANLWKPYHAMKEIWQASVEPTNWQYQSAPRVLPVWWAFWLLAAVLANVSFRMAADTDDLDMLLNANLFSQIAETVGIPLNLAFLDIVRRVNRLQSDHWGRLSPDA